MFPVREEKADFEYVSSPLLRTQEPNKSIFKVFVPIVVLVLVIAGAGYLYFTGKKIITSEQTVTIKPAVTSIETEKSKQVEAVKGAEAEKESTKPQQPVENEGDYYTVQVKDQLNEIGKKYFGNYKDWKKIYDLNKEKIGDPNLIFPGQKFKIPK